MSKALNGGKNAAGYLRIKTSSDEKVLAFVREKEGEKLVYISNMSKGPVSFTLDLQGNFVDYMNSNPVDLKLDQEMNFKPWEYKILLIK